MALGWTLQRNKTLSPDLRPSARHGSLAARAGLHPLKGSNMQTKTKLKMAVDVGMTALLPILMAYMLTGQETHE